MKVEHTKPHPEDHRVIVELTTLEAWLLVDGTERVRRVLARKLRKNLAGCDHAAEERP